MLEKFDSDFRHGLEFILRVKEVYSESDILRKDYQTYFKMLREAEEQERENIARIQEVNK